MATVPTPKWGKVWLVRFDPSAGPRFARSGRPSWSTWMPSAAAPYVTNRGSGHGLEACDFGNLSWFVFLPAASEKWPLERLRGGRVPGKVGVQTRFVRKLGEVTNAQIDVHGSGKLYAGIRRSSFRDQHRFPDTARPAGAG